MSNKPGSAPWVLYAHRVQITQIKTPFGRFPSVTQI
jgi:hypothetical protein